MTVTHATPPLCRPRGHNPRTSYSSYDRVTCARCLTAQEKAAAAKEAAWHARHALPAVHPAWPLMEAETKRTGWPVAYPGDLQHDRRALAYMEPTMPFAWLLTERGTHLINPMTTDGGFNHPPRCAIGILHACWPTPSKSTRQDVPADPSGLWFWWNGNRLEGIHSREHLQNYVSRAAEELIPIFRAARLIARIGLRSHDDLPGVLEYQTAFPLPDWFSVWLYRSHNDNAFWRLVANPCARPLHDDPRGDPR
mgnify:CR=1 FL=1